MKRKIGGIVLALLLAVVGTVALMAYVNKAKDDAVKEGQQVKVLVVTTAIPLGASLDTVKAAVEPTDVPRRLVADDAVTAAELDTLDPTLVAGMALQPKEQLLRSRLVDPRTFVRVAVPDGLQEITVAIDPERALGGTLQPGQKVGVLLSFDPFLTSAAATPTTVPTGSVPEYTPTLQTPNTTHLTLQQVLVTAVQFSAQDSDRKYETETTVEDDDSTVTTVNESPGDEVLVTLAVTAAEAEQITFAAEFGHIWLTLQNDATDPDGGRILTLDQIYVTVPE